MRMRILIGIALAGVLALGVWLWSRNGLAVWVDAAIAFCT